MEEICQFSSCHWVGIENDLLDHCESYHGKFIKNIDKHQGFDFTLNDIWKEEFLLRTKNGLYWFLMDPIERDDCIKKGIFAIGDSEICDYTAKIGRNGDGYVKSLGPYQTKPLTKREFDLEWPYPYIEFLNEEVNSNSIQVFFGEYKEQHYYNGRQHNVNWEEYCNELCLEKFTCLQCFKYIRSQARFCENRHFLCSECFEKMQKLNLLKCSMCQGNFPDECDEEIENVLKFVKFPDIN